MRHVLLVTLVSACGFTVQGQAPVNDDAKRDSGGGGEGTPTDGAIDAPIDAAIDAPIDARECPPAPPNCQAFTCAGSSHCYYLCGTADTEPWADGRDQCVDDNLGCLATIEDAAENQCITQATNPAFPNIVWMGYVQSSNGSEPSGGWGWQCGSSTYTNWSGGEPNNLGGNEDCAALNNGGGWIDGGCNSNARWVCELP